MTDFDNETIKRFISLLRNVSKNETDRLIRGLKIETYRDMKVVEVSNISNDISITGQTSDKKTVTGTWTQTKTVSATVADLVTRETLTSIPNCTGEVLTVDQIVRVYTSSDLFPGTTTQSYIGSVKI